MPPRRFRAGIVGLGMALAPHARALSELGERVRVGAVWSPCPEERERASRRWGFPAVEEAAAIFEDPEIDFLLLLTPPGARREFLEAAAAAGKAVLMEKPVARDLAEARELVGICERAGVTLGIVLQQRFRESVRRLRTLIAAGETGALAAAQLWLPWWRPQSYFDEGGRGTVARDGSGVLASQAIHALDLLGWIAGPVAEVTALAATTRLHHMETEDFVVAGLRFENGAPGGVFATVAEFPGFPEEIHFLFERVTAILEGATLRLLWHDGREERSGEPVPTGTGVRPMDFPHRWHRALLADFLDALEAGRQPAIPGREALTVHALIDALLASSREGRSITANCSSVWPPPLAQRW